LLFLMLLATNMGFVIETRADYGPVVLMLLIQAVVLTLLARLTEKGGLLMLGAFMSALFLGIYDKLNFLWFVFALAPGAALFAPQLWRNFRGRRIGAILMIAAAGILLSVILIRFVLPIMGLYPERTLPASQNERLCRTLSTCDGALSGRALMYTMTQRFFPSAFPTIPIAGLLVTSIVLSSAATGWMVALSRWGNEQTALWSVSLTVQTVAIFLQMSQTAQATGTRHAMMLVPLAFASLVVGIAALARGISDRFPTRLWSRFSAGFLLAGALTIGALQVRAGVGALHLLRNEKNLAPAWSTRITELARYLDAVSPQYDTILCTDWGLGVQLFVFCRSSETRDKIADIWNFFGVPPTPDIRDHIYHHFLEGKRALLLTHGPNCVLMPHTRDHLMEALSQAPVRSRRLTEISGGRDEQALYEVYESLPLILAPGPSGEGAFASPRSQAR
jgi:MFS family permease